MPMSPLQATLREAMKDAMRARDKPRLETIRLALSEIRRVEVDERIECDDARNHRHTLAHGQAAEGFHHPV